MNHASRHDSPASLWSAWSRADLAWVFGLSLPLLALSLHFKLIRIAQRKLSPSPFELTELLFSDLSTILAWALVSLGLVAFAQRRAARLAVYVLLQSSAVFYALVLLGAHGYFMSTGSSLDYPMLAFSLTNLPETLKVIGSAKSMARVLAFGITVVAVLGLPWLFARFATPKRGARLSDRWLALLHSWAVAGILLGMAIGVRSTHGLDLSRDPFLNIALTLEGERDPEDDALLARARLRPRGASAVSATAATRKKNVVIILLESTRARSTSLYGGPHDTTPFLAELAKKAVVVDGMHAVEPHTTKAIASTLCGIEPRPGVGIAESVPGGILGKCLPDLLRPHGYRSAYFQTAIAEFENREQLVRNMGFDEFTSGEGMPSDGLKRANYFGFEDKQLIAPIARWLEDAKEKGEPFLLSVLTNQAHHDYAPVRTYGFQNYVVDVMENRYLNAVHYDDVVLKELFAHFTRLGLVDDTLFVLLGDHGEGFGEHGRFAHDDTIYEEGLHIPMLVLDVGGPHAPGRRKGLFNELDVVPTVFELLGLRVPEASYVGRSIFQEGPPRVLYAACYNDGKCLARYEGTRKFIHHFDRQKDELFDLAADPDERHNLARGASSEIGAMQKDVVEWYKLARAMYSEVAERVAAKYVSDERPDVQFERRITFGSSVQYLGYSLEKDAVSPGEWFTVTWHFRVLEPLPEGVKLFIHGYDGKRRFNWSHVPVERLYPEDVWRAGEYISDPHTIRMRHGFLADKLIIRGGFWNPRGSRLPTHPKDKDDAPVLAEIPVAR